MNNTFIHSSAVISDNVIIGNNVYIGPNCTIGFPSFQKRKDKRENQLKGKQAYKLIIQDNTKIYGNSVICQNTIIGKNCRIDYHSFIGENTKIGDNCVIEYGARIYDNVIIGSNCEISGFISNDCIIEDNSIIQGELIHKFKEIIRNKPEPSCIVKKNSFIGKGTMVIGNITINEGSYIGCNSVVTKTTKKNKLYYGIPAKEKGEAPEIYIDK